MSKCIVKVEIRSGDDINRSLKKFKRLCEQAGIRREYKKRQEHKKPSIVNKEKTEAALKRRLKADRRSSQSYRKY